MPAGVAHTIESYGASWGDLNGDGYLDIFASNHRTQPSLYLNRGNGTFVETGPQVLTWQNRPNADTHGGSWADFDNDGDQDLLISTGTGNLSEFLVNENGRLVDRVVEYGVGITNLGGRLPVWVDYDRDGRLDFVVTQYGGIAKLFHQNASGVKYSETTSASKLLCKRFHYGQLLDVNGDGNLDFLCPDETVFPQKIYNMLPFPWQKLFDVASPNGIFPPVQKIADSIIADFDNDGRNDVFLLSGVQLRTSSVVQAGQNNIEALLTGGTKGFKFKSSGLVTFSMDWNKADEGTGTDITKIQIGAANIHPTATTFTLDPADPNVAGMPPMPTDATKLPILQIGYDPATTQWTLIVQTKLTQTSTSVFSEAYIMVSTALPITSLVSTGLWPSDKPARPTLLMNFSGGWSDETVNAGLQAPVQCVSATAGDYDNDGDVDLYLACRTGASNLANILYENQGNGHFVAVPNAGGAAGPVGIAIGSGAGTSDTAITGDYDGDGFLDIFVTNGFNLRPLYIGGPNKLFHNAGNGNHWIELDLVGAGQKEAIGARVYATANSVRQFREQNGGYHRWSQDAKRLHFGLAGASTVDLRVEWPSGTVENFTAVPSNVIYKITEGSGIAPVAMGVSKAYQCGAPALNGATDVGVFIWRDCPSGQWRMKTSAGGGSITYTGSVTSSANFVSVAPQGLGTGDSVDFTSNPKRISYVFLTNNSSNDGVNFNVADGANTCLKVDTPAGVQVYYGPFRAPMNQPFDLEGQGACINPPSELAISPLTVSEGAGQADFTVTLTPAATQTVTVTYTTTDGTAKAGQDYVATTGTVTFDPGETSKPASVPVIDDLLAEGVNETFKVTLSNPANAVLSTVFQATGTIQDNEISPCGAPAYNAGTQTGLFVWRDCTSGKWFARFTAGGSPTTLVYTGTVVADVPFTSVTAYSIEAAYDTLDTTNPSVISFILKTNNAAQDGFNFVLASNTSACFSTSLPNGAGVFVGPSMTPISQPFRMDTLGPCQ
ncbi:MAG: FG-GAP-like repeat-containing protein [Steroidobacteraceae bacterium]